MMTQTSDSQFSFKDATYEGLTGKEGDSQYNQQDHLEKQDSQGLLSEIFEACSKIEAQLASLTPSEGGEASTKHLLRLLSRRTELEGHNEQLQMHQSMMECKIQELQTELENQRNLNRSLKAQVGQPHSAQSMNRSRQQQESVDANLKSKNQELELRLSDMEMRLALSDQNWQLHFGQFEQDQQAAFDRVRNEWTQKELSLMNQLLMANPESTSNSDAQSLGFVLLSLTARMQDLTQEIGSFSQIEESKFNIFQEGYKTIIRNLQEQLEQSTSRAKYLKDQSALVERLEEDNTVLEARLLALEKSNSDQQDESKNDPNQMIHQKYKQYKWKYIIACHQLSQLELKLGAHHQLVKSWEDRMEEWAMDMKAFLLSNNLSLDSLEAKYNQKQIDAIKLHYEALSTESAAKDEQIKILNNNIRELESRVRSNPAKNLSPTKLKEKVTIQASVTSPSRQLEFNNRAIEELEHTIASRDRTIKELRNELMVKDRQYTQALENTAISAASKTNSAGKDYERNIFEMELEQANSTIKKLQLDLNNRSQMTFQKDFELTELSTALQSSKRQAEKTESTLRNLQSEINKLENQNRALQRRFDQVNREKLTMTEEFDTQKMQSDYKITKMTAELQSLHRQYSEMEIEDEQLRETLSNERMKLGSHSAELEMSQTEVARRVQEIESLRNELRSANNDIIEMESRIMKAEAEANRAKITAVTSYNSELKIAEENLIQREKVINRMRNELQSSEMRASELDDELRKALQEKTFLKQENSSLNNSLTELEGELNKAKILMQSKTRQYQSLIVEHEDEMEKLRSELATTKGIVSQLRFMAEDHQMETQRLKSEISRIQSETSQLKSYILELQDENSHAKMKSNSSKNILDSQADELTNLRLDGEEKERDLINVRRELAEALSAIRDFQDQIRGYKSQSNDLRNRHQEEVEELKNEIYSREASQNSLISEIKKIKTLLEDQQREVGQWQNTVQRKNNQLNLITQQHEEQRQQLVSRFQRERETLEGRANLEIKNREETIERLITELNQVKNEIKFYREAVEEREAEMFRLKEGFDQARKDGTKVSEELQSLEETLYTKEQYLSRLQLEAGKVPQLTHSLESAQGALSSLRTEFTQLKANFNHQREDIDNYDLNLGRATSEIQNQRIALQKLTGINEEANMAINKLKSQLNSQANAIRELEAQSEGQAELMRKMKAQIEAHKNSIRLQNEDLDEREQILIRFKKELTEAKEVARELELDLSKTKIELKTAKSSFDSLRGDHQKLIDRAGKHQFRVTDLQKELTRVKLQVTEEIEDALAKERRQIFSLKSQIHTLEMNIDERDYTIRLLNMKASGESTDNASFTEGSQKIRRLQSEVFNMQLEFDKKQSEVISLKRSLDVLAATKKSEIEQFQTQKAQLQQNVSALRESERSLRNQLGDYQFEISSLTSRLNAVQSQKNEVDIKSLRKRSEASIPVERSSSTDRLGLFEPNKNDSLYKNLSSAVNPNWSALSNHEDQYQLESSSVNNVIFSNTANSNKNDTFNRLGLLSNKEAVERPPSHSHLPPRDVSNLHAIVRNNDIPPRPSASMPNRTQESMRDNYSIPSSQGPTRPHDGSISSSQQASRPVSGQPVNRSNSQEGQYVQNNLFMPTQPSQEGSTGLNALIGSMKQSQHSAQSQNAQRRDSLSSQENASNFISKSNNEVQQQLGMKRTDSGREGQAQSQQGQIGQTVGRGQLGMMQQGQPGMVQQGMVQQVQQGQPGMMQQSQPGMIQGQPGIVQQGQPGMMQQGQSGMVPQGQPGMTQQGQPGIVQQGQPGIVQQGQSGVMQQGQQGQQGMIQQGQQGQQGMVQQGQQGMVQQGQPGLVQQGQPGMVQQGQNIIPNQLQQMPQQGQHQMMQRGSQSLQSQGPQQMVPQGHNQIPQQQFMQQQMAPGNPFQQPGMSNSMGGGFGGMQPQQGFGAPAMMSQTSPSPRGMQPQMMRQGPNAPYGMMGAMAGTMPPQMPGQRLMRP